MKLLKKIYLSGIILALTHGALMPTTYWKWQDININAVSFPASFDWGLTTLSYETEGYAKSSTWYAWDNQTNMQGRQFTRSQTDNSSGHIKNYKADIQLMKEMGISTYCFSIDWSRIEPEQGRFDEEYIQEIIDFCNELVENNIAITVVLKDYCDPLWWGYLGGFEYEKNIPLFERYCLKMYESLGSKVDRWITFWAPENYAVLSYLLGSIPPGVRSLNRTATVLKNELEAHVRVYQAIKAAPHGSTSRIGIIKHVHILEPWHFWDHASCYIANMLTNYSFYNFFTTGTFAMKIPFPGKIGAWINHTNAFAAKSLDFIGINYHSHGYIKNIVNHIGNPSEMPTDVPGMTVYPEGLYLAIKEISEKIAKKLNIPMIITQNGIATRDESMRDLFIKRHIYALHKAKTEGHNVEGYYYYSFLDGFSWGSYDTRFGLFSVDYATKERILKSGASAYLSTIKKR